MAVPLTAGRCLGQQGSCPGAGCPPALWVPCSAAAGCCSQGELSEDQGGALCLEGRADPKTCCWLQHFFSYQTNNVGSGATQRQHSMKLLLHFAPVLLRKALGRVKGKLGEGGGSEVWISHLSLTRVQETWAGTMPMCWWIWCPCVQPLPALGSAPRSPGRAEGSRWLLCTAHLDAPAPALTLPAAVQGMCSGHGSTGNQSPLEGLCHVAPLPDTMPRRVLGPGSECASTGPCGNLAAQY